MGTSWAPSATCYFLSLEARPGCSGGPWPLHVTWGSVGVSALLNTYSQRWDCLQKGFLFVSKLVTDSAVFLNANFKYKSKTKRKFKKLKFWLYWASKHLKDLRALLWAAWETEPPAAETLRGASQCLCTSASLKLIYSLLLSNFKCSWISLASSWLFIST